MSLVSGVERRQLEESIPHSTWVRPSDPDVADQGKERAVVPRRRSNSALE